jgi:hypothetical protein
LTRIFIAREQNERRLISGNPTGLSQTFIPKSYHLATANAPLLAQRAGAVDQYDRRAVVRRAALHVDATAEVFRNDAAFDEPSLVGAAVALNYHQRRAIRGLSVLRIDALTVPSYQLRADDRDGIGHRHIRRRAGGEHTSDQRQRGQRDSGPHLYQPITGP